MNRVYYDFRELEEYTDGMWRITRGAERKKYIGKSAALMRQPDKFEEAMIQAMEAWPKSFEHNLSCEGMNRIAWLGHAGCCVSEGSPEDCTRAGWYKLNDAEMDLANEAAARVLFSWLSAENGGLLL